MSEIFGIENEAATQLDHVCQLDFKEPASQHRLTNIVASISKASGQRKVLKEMVMSGMNIARLNCSHDSHEFYEDTIKLLNVICEEYSKELGYPYQVAVAIDTKGPEIRTGILEIGANAEIELKQNDNLRLSINRDLTEKCNRECIFIDYENIIYVVFPGSLVYLNDGALRLVVKEVGVDCVTCQVQVGGMLGSRKKVTLPGVTVDLPAVSEKDGYDLRFAIEHNIDMIFASSIRSASAVKELRAVLGEKGKHIKLIAKIDNEQGLQRFDEILKASDGILFERADIAIEIPLSKIVLAQKAILAQCNRAGKPAIVASRLLESMRYKSQPTMAEVSELGNAILDGADCVMLSSETAIGLHPVQVLKTMATIIQEAELALWHRNLFKDLLATHASSLDATHSIAISAIDASIKTLATAIVCLTTSGNSSYLLSKYRPRCPILAVTRCPRTFRQSHLYHGVVPIFYAELPNKNWIADVEARIRYAMNCGRAMNIIKTGDTVVIVSAWQNASGFTNTLRLVYAFFEDEDIDCILKADMKSSPKVK